MLRKPVSYSSRLQGISKPAKRPRQRISLPSATFQPAMSQLAKLHGRRWLTMYAIAVFILSSGISGGAKDGLSLGSI